MDWSVEKNITVVHPHCGTPEAKAKGRTHERYHGWNWAEVSITSNRIQEVRNGTSFLSIVFVSSLLTLSPGKNGLTLSVPSENIRSPMAGNTIERSRPVAPKPHSHAGPAPAERKSDERPTPMATRTNMDRTRGAASRRPGLPKSPLRI